VVMCAEGATILETTMTITPRSSWTTRRTSSSGSTAICSLHTRLLETVFAPQRHGSRDLRRRSVGRSEIGAKPGPAGCVAGSGW
jgi:hypothetical protein